MAIGDIIREKGVEGAKKAVAKQRKIVAKSIAKKKASSSNKSKKQEKAEVKRLIKVGSEHKTSTFDRFTELVKEAKDTGAGPRQARALAEAQIAVEQGRLQRGETVRVADTGGTESELEVVDGRVESKAFRAETVNVPVKPKQSVFSKSKVKDVSIGVEDNITSMSRDATQKEINQAISSEVLKPGQSGVLTVSRGKLKEEVIASDFFIGSSIEEGKVLTGQFPLSKLEPKPKKRTFTDSSDDLSDAFGEYTESLVRGVKKLPDYGKTLALEGASKLAGKELLPKNVMKEAVGFADVKDALRDKDLRNVAGLASTVGFIAATPAILASKVGSVALTSLSGFNTFKATKQAIENPSILSITFAGLSGVVTVYSGVRAFKNLAPMFSKTDTRPTNIREIGVLKSTKSSSSLGKSKSSVSRKELVKDVTGKIKGKPYSASQEVKNVNSLIVHPKGLIASKSVSASSVETFGKFTVHQRLQGDKIFFTVVKKGKVVKFGSYKVSKGGLTLPGVGKLSEVAVGKVKVTVGAPEIVSKSNLFGKPSSVSASTGSKRFVRAFDGGEVRRTVEQVSKRDTLKTVTVLSKGGTTTINYAPQIIGDKVTFTPVSGLTKLNTVVLSKNPSRNIKPVIEHLESGIIKVTKTVDPRVGKEFLDSTVTSYTKSLSHTPYVTPKFTETFLIGKKAKSVLISPQLLESPLTVKVSDSISKSQLPFSPLTEFKSGMTLIQVSKPTVAPIIFNDLFNDAQTGNRMDSTDSFKTSVIAGVQTKGFVEMDTRVKIKDRVSAAVGIKNLVPQKMVVSTLSGVKPQHVTRVGVDLDAGLDVDVGVDVGVGLDVGLDVKPQITVDVGADVGRVPPPPPGFLTPSLLTPKFPKSFSRMGGGGFSVFVGRKDRKVFFSKNDLTLEEAVKFGSKGTRSTAAASFDIRRDGKVLDDFDKKKVLDKLGRRFRLSRGGVNPFVQRREFRISSFGEKREITDLAKRINSRKGSRRLF